jgi:hypothetical protein
VSTRNQQNVYKAQSKSLRFQQQVRHYNGPPETCRPQGMASTSSTLLINPSINNLLSEHLQVCSNLTLQLRAPVRTPS